MKKPPQPKYRTEWNLANETTMSGMSEVDGGIGPPDWHQAGLVGETPVLAWADSGSSFANAKEHFC
jgi:hypothetical protein